MQQFVSHRVWFEEHTGVPDLMQSKDNMCTSIDAGRSETGMMAEGFGHLQYLVSQLPGRAQYNCTRPLWLALLPLLLLLPQLVHLQHWLLA